jgi:hypothetical protein
MNEWNDAQSSCAAPEDEHGPAVDGAAPRVKRKYNKTGKYSKKMKGEAAAAGKFSGSSSSNGGDIDAGSDADDDEKRAAAAANSTLGAGGEERGEAVKKAKKPHDKSLPLPKEPVVGTRGYLLKCPNCRPARGYTCGRCRARAADMPYVFCYTIVLPSFFLFLFVMMSLSVSLLSIYCFLPAFSDTT